MTLLQEPEPSSGGGSRWVAVVLLVIATGGVGGYWYLSRTGDEPDVDARPAPTASAPVRPADPAPPPVPRSAPPPVEAKPSPPPPELAEAPPAPTPPSTRLRITSDVPGADVFIDREYAGKTPFDSADVEFGRHRVNVSAPGYDGFSQDVEVGDTLTELDVAFRVVRLDQRASVIHKHRFGDCSGELMADIEGIRYQTDDDDAFSVTFGEIEEFTVDYLEHNLRLKVRNGRTYNFTDGEPNADKLFVFHKEVDEARARLSAGTSRQ